jgi:CheY-like chemotaxis protein
MAKILLVEDDKSLRQMYGERLLAEGFDIVSAGDGEEALSMAINEMPDLIISDVMMPKISGFDMLDILRSTTETRDIKVIMMTALSSEDQRKRGESLGADRYLVKSQVGIEDVVRAVHEVLGDAPSIVSSAPTAGSAETVAPVSFRSGPQPVTVPARNQTPAPNPNFSTQPAPSAPASAPTAAAPQATSPAPAPQQPSAFLSPAPADNTTQPLGMPTAEPVSLPQPTAPFSTPRPASLGDRVIQPITDANSTTEGVTIVAESSTQATQRHLLNSEVK